MQNIYRLVFSARILSRVMRANFKCRVVSVHRLCYQITALDTLLTAPLGQAGCLARIQYPPVRVYNSQSDNTVPTRLPTECFKQITRQDQP